MNRYLAEHVKRRQQWSTDKEPRVARLRRSRRYFHRQVDQLISSLIVPNSYVLDLGCGDGTTLARCAADPGWGIDLDEAAVSVARENNSEMTFLNAPIEDLEDLPLPNPDYIVMSMLLDEVYDVQNVLGKVRYWSARPTRVMIVTHSRLWRPLILLAEKIGIKKRVAGENYVPWDEIENMLAIEGFEVTKRQDGVLIPIHIPLIAPLLNRWIAPLPLIRALCLIRITVARSVERSSRPVQSVSIIVAARNESGHIDELIGRVPMLAERQELIFVEGNSNDDTWEVIQRAIAERQHASPMELVALQQPGKGKADAVRVGFARATGDVLIILDADISVPPEELPLFVRALDDDRCEFANGSRLVYPMEAKAMRFLNILGNKFFGYLFSYLLGQPIRDTLCGTKVLRRSDYDRIVANRDFFGDFDPFGDFDLLFGASRLGLKIRDVPVHYKERTYGETNISRFSHGWLLVRMSSVAAARLKFVG